MRQQSADGADRDNRPAGVPQGTYPLTINAFGSNGNAGQASSQLIYPFLQVGSGGTSFSITASVPQTIAPGGTAQYTVTVSGSGGLGNVTLTASGGPQGATVLFNGAGSATVPVGGSATMTVVVPSNEGLGSYPVPITGMLGTVPKYSSASLTVSLPAAASILTPPPGANIAGGNTTFTWSAGLGAAKYTVTSVAANGQTSSATTGAGQLSATLSLPASSQTATVTLQTMTGGGALTQTYAYTIQPPGTAQPLTMASGNPAAVVQANGQEVLYTFLYANPSGGARPSPQDIGDCESTDVAIRIRIAQLTGNTATLGFTAPVGTAPIAAFDWECDDGDGSGSGGGGSGSSGDPSPNIDSVSPVPLVAGTTTQITINGEYFGLSQGFLDFGGGCSQSGSPGWSAGLITAYVSVDPSASGYCTVAVGASVDDSGFSFLPAPGSSSESDPFPIALEGPEVAAQTQCNPGTAARGTRVTCAVSGVSANAVSAWSFSGGGVTVNGPASVLTWSGVMITSGTISATVNGTPLSQAMTINARSWHVNPAAAVQVSNGQLVVNGTAVTLPVPPVPSGAKSGLGESAYALNYASFNLSVVPNGPNAGFGYFASPLTFPANSYSYELNPNLLDQNSDFSQHQSGSGGFISWNDLITQTKRHEYNSATQSHWAFYSNSMNKNSPGDYFEARLLTPGSDQATFLNVTKSGLTNLLAQIFADFSVEPYPVNYSETGVPLGNVNYGPTYTQSN